MTLALKRMGKVIMLMVTLALPAFSAKGQYFTGEVSDSMCGAEHMMKGSKAECARACAAKGSNYALVVGDKVYTLETKDKALLDKLSKIAGQKARITGKADGESIVVSAVSASK
jgi:hypothetical protein